LYIHTYYACDSGQLERASNYNLKAMIVTIFREDYFEYGLGLLDPHPEDSWDADSEAYFSAIDASQRPDSYSSLAEGQETSSSVLGGLEYLDLI
jgi:hypothetical protein